jgi:Ala-tRNA(Pro) deacylase
MRVLQFLSEQHIDYQPLVHPPAFSSQKRAKHLGVSGRQVAKTVLLAGPRGYLLAVLPATHQVDTERLAAEVGGPIRLANEQEIGRVFPDCEWGVVEPFGTLYGIPTVLDQSVNPETEIVFEAHTHAEAVRMKCSDFERLEQPQRLSFARPIQESLAATETR